jgi:4-hydroxy-tetrahydrodipicolinate synthase
MFKGSNTALVTPFDNDGALDEKSFRDLIDWQITEGTSGLVPVGTTGESPTLSHEEHKRVVEICVEVADRRVPVIAGAGSNNTAEAIDLAQHAERAGADAVLVVTPNYNKPTQDGLVVHFSAIAEAISLPIIIYNIPGRSVVDMAVDTMAHLHKNWPTIIGVKDSTAALDRVSAQRLACGVDFVQLTGEDASALGHAAHGGVGAISVTSNVAPRQCAEFQAALAVGDFAKALELQDKLMPLHQALFLEPGVSGAKYALSKLGRCGNNLRSPILPVGKATEEAIDTAMRHVGLLN